MTVAKRLDQLSSHPRDMENLLMPLLQLSSKILRIPSVTSISSVHFRFSARTIQDLKDKMDWCVAHRADHFAVNLWEEIQLPGIIVKEPEDVVNLSRKVTKLLHKIIIRNDWKDASKNQSSFIGLVEWFSSSISFVLLDDNTKQAHQTIVEDSLLDFLRWILSLCSDSNIKSALLSSQKFLDSIMLFYPLVTCFLQPQIVLQYLNSVLLVLFIHSVRTNHDSFVTHPFKDTYEKIIKYSLSSLLCHLPHPNEGLLSFGEEFCWVNEQFCTLLQGFWAKQYPNQFLYLLASDTMNGSDQISQLARKELKVLEMVELETTSDWYDDDIDAEILQKHNSQQENNVYVVLRDIGG